MPENCSKCSDKDIKKGYRRSPNLDNLKSNTMKNTVQKYKIYPFVLYRKWKKCMFPVIFYFF